METINISTSQDTQFDFNLTATGLDVKTGSVFFCIEQSKHLSLQVKCRHSTGQQWSVTFPKGALEYGEHKYKLCVVIDDFYFEPMSGKLNVVSDKTVSVNNKEDKKQDKKEDKSESESKPSQSKKEDTDKPKSKPQRRKDDKKESIKEQSEDTTPSTDYQFFTTDHPYGKLTDKGEKDRRVREILKSFKN